MREAVFCSLLPVKEVEGNMLPHVLGICSLNVALHILNDFRFLDKDCLKGENNDDNNPNTMNKGKDVFLLALIRTLSRFKSQLLTGGYTEL